MTLCAAVKRSGEFDVMHSHAYLWGIPLEPFAGCPLVHTMHVTPDVNTAAPWELNPASCVTALSEFQWQPYPDLRPAAVIPHGVDVGQHTFQPVRGDYACFLGRFTRCKGPVQAIQAARNVGLPLILAGPRNDYFDTHVAPLVDGDSVVYAGPVYGADRDALLGGAAVLLYPLQCPEPFGLVMVEAMMSGTPVAAYSIGAVPEVLDDGITGAGAVPDEDFTVAIERAMSLDRSTVRQRAIERFSAERMAASYLDVYERVVEQASVREG
jgi:glycosyltransferase involved in cell wall biosynthesis